MAVDYCNKEVDYCNKERKKNMQKLWSVSSTKKQDGKTTIILLKTEDEEVIRKLLEPASDKTEVKKENKASKTTKAAAVKALSEPKKKDSSKVKTPDITLKNQKPLKPISTNQESLKALPKPVEKSKPKLSRKSIVGKAEIKYNTRNLDSKQIWMSNHQSM